MQADAETDIAALLQKKCADISLVPEQSDPRMQDFVTGQPAYNSSDNTRTVNDEGCASPYP